MSETTLAATMRRTLTAGGLAGTEWSVDIRDAASGKALFARDSHRLLRTASVAKVYLLIEIAARVVSGALDPGHIVDRRSVAPVADSGLWQHLRCDRLAVADLAVLVGSVSDNLATNALVELVGLAAIQARASRHAADGSTLHDLVRDERGGRDPATLSEGSAADLVSLFVRLHQRNVESPGVSDLVLSWLAAGADLSMVAGALGLDPLSHAGSADRGIRLWNKTGTDTGVRADVGTIARADRVLSYAVLCNWTPATRPDPRDEVLAAMRSIGESLRGLGGS
jgi:beta-lactamase class A